MNTPNKLTLLRVALVPFFIAFLLARVSMPHHYLIAGLIFGIASYTDHLDGMLARKHGQITNFGKFMDPLADKILVISALVCFVSLDLANVWLVLLMIAREFMVTSIRLVAVDSGVVIAANKWGKVKTVSQIISICVVLLLQYILELVSLNILPVFTVFGNDAQNAFVLIGQFFLCVAAFFTVFSGIVYLRQNWDVVKQAK